jgi:hypothetical protein
LVFFTSLSWIVKTFSFELKLAGQAKVFNLIPVVDWGKCFFTSVCIFLLFKLRILFANHFKFVSVAVPYSHILLYLLFCWNVVYEGGGVAPSTEYIKG